HNVLCRVDDGTPTCVGLLDLDGASGAPPESDLARFDVLHGRLFGQPIERPVRERMREGYRGSIDETVLAFFRTAHLANLGFHSALVGDVEHAADVIAVLDVETQRAEALCSASNAHTVPAGTQLASRRADA